MKIQLYALFDRATQMYANPMYLATKGQALRTLGDEVNRAAEDNPLYKHPDDYDLYYLGDYDSSSGLFETGMPEMVIRCRELVTTTN